MCKFCSKFYMLCSSTNILKIQLRFDKVTESLKVGTFFETQHRPSLRDALLSD